MTVPAGEGLPASQQLSIHTQVKVMGALIILMAMMWIALATFFIYYFRRPQIGDLMQLRLSEVADSWKSIADNDSIELDDLHIMSVRSIP